MKISDFVHELQELWDRFGDVDVRIGDSDGDLYEPFMKHEVAQPGHRGGRIIVQGDWDSEEGEEAY